MKTGTKEGIFFSGCWKHWLLGISCLLLSLSLVGQTVESSCLVHFDKPVYVSGEVLWYKIYLPQAFSGTSLSFEVKLVGENGQQLQHYFLQNQGAAVLEGYFKIPYDQQTGMCYLMVFGTHHSSMDLIKILEAPVPIYNDLLQEEARPATTAIPASPTLPQLDQLQVHIDLKRDSFQRRSKVEAIVSVTDAAGQPVPAELSVSVADWSLLSRAELGFENLISSNYSATIPARELKNGLHLRGQTLDSLGQPTPVNILGYYSSAERKLQYNRTDQTGHFFIDIQDFSGNKPIQLIDYQSTSIHLRTQDQYSIDRPVGLAFNSAISAFLASSRRRKKTYQLHQTFEQPIQPEAFAFDTTTFRDYRRLRPDEYEAFPDFPTFLQEVYLKMTLLQQKDKTYKVNFFVNRHGDFERYPRPPLFFVDGKMTRNLNFIAGLELANIKQIDFFHQLKSLRAQFGPLGQFGVAMITTNSGNQTLLPEEEADILDFHGFLPRAEFPALASADFSTGNFPTFRPLLYWAPQLKTDQQGRHTISFIQSDDLSTFCIEVVAQSKDGKRGVSRRKYRVFY